MAKSIQSLSVDLIDPGNNDRVIFNQEKLNELAASIREHGLAQPITVRPKGDRFEVVAGERRFRATRDILRRPTVDCIVRDLTDLEASALMLVENVARADLNPLEEADAYFSRMELHGWSVTVVAEKAGVSTDRVRGRLALRNLTPQMQKLVASGQMPLQQAEVLGQQSTMVQGEALRVWQAKRNMTLSELREIISHLVAAESQPVMFMVADALEEKVTANAKPVIGQGAEIPIIEDSRIPDVEVGRGETVGEACDRYMKELAAKGFVSEAAAVGKLYRALVRSRKTFAAGNVLERAGWDTNGSKAGKEGIGQNVAAAQKARG